MSTVRVTRAGRVWCSTTLEVPLSAVAVWGQLRDFARYARQDFFHADIQIEGGIPRAGAGLALSHRYAGFCIRRVGRILIWREGVGYSFSDLSVAGPRRGFPHVFSYRLKPTGESQCKLHITVGGLWTTGRIPRWAANLWLRWVFGHVVRTVRNQLIVYDVWRREIRPPEPRV